MDVDQFNRNSLVSKHKKEVDDLNWYHWYSMPNFYRLDKNKCIVIILVIVIYILP